MHDQLRASGRKLSPRLVHSYQVSPPILLAQQRLRAERRGEARLDPLLGRLLEAVRNQQERGVVEASGPAVGTAVGAGVRTLARRKIGGPNGSQPVSSVQRRVPPQ